MERLAAAALSQLSSIPAGSIIHDNGCGLGAATAAIVAKVPPSILPSLKITGSDILEPVIASYRAAISANSWPAIAIVADSNALPFEDNTFTHSIGNALLFAGPTNDGRGVVKEAYRTLKPGGTFIVNSFRHVPNLEPVQAASVATRPAGAPVPRDGMAKWADPAFLAGIVESGGFQKEAIEMREVEVFITTSTKFQRYVTLLWSFMGGTTAAGWTPEDEERWDDAVEVIKQELSKTQGFELLDNGHAKLRFVCNVAIATK